MAALFLDEVGELPPALQSRLLKCQVGEIRRWEQSPNTVDVRVVCATHRSLEEMVSGTFREDLLFRRTRRNQGPVLREHAGDLKLLIRHFIEKKQQSIPDGIQLITDHAIEIMQAYSWPGNVRELANCVEHALVLCDELPIRQNTFRSGYNVRLRKKCTAIPKQL